MENVSINIIDLLTIMTLSITISGVIISIIRYFYKNYKFNKIELDIIHTSDNYIKDSYICWNIAEKFTTILNKYPNDKRVQQKNLKSYVIINDNKLIIKHLKWYVTKYKLKTFYKKLLREIDKSNYCEDWNKNW